MKLKVFGNSYKKDVLVGTEQSGTITLQSIKGRSVGEAREIGELEKKANSNNLDMLILIKRISKTKGVTSEEVAQRLDSFNLDDDVTSDFLPEIKEALAVQGTGIEVRILAVTLMVKNRLVTIDDNKNRIVGCPEWTTEDSCNELSEELANEVYSFYLAEAARKDYVPSDKAEGNEQPEEREIAVIAEEVATAA